MKAMRAKRPRIQLAPEPYEQLRRHVLQRDGWRCQKCGRRTNLQVHHTQLRSQLGHDSEENLIALCSQCHALFHDF